MQSAQSIVVSLAVAYLAFGAFLYFYQRHLLYLPATTRVLPATAGLSNIEEVVLPTRDGETLVTWFAKPSPGKPVILFFHGNGGSIGGRAERLASYQIGGFGALFVSYRGYGGSTGSPTEAGITVDAETAYDWLVAQGYTPQQIVSVGESLGSGVAVGLASAHKIAAVALEAPYTAMSDVAAFHYWYLPVRLLLKDRFDSIGRIAKIGAPVLISHGNADRVVPYSFGRKLFEAAAEPKEFFEMPGAGHEAIFDRRVWQREMDFFDRYATKQ